MPGPSGILRAFGLGLACLCAGGPAWGYVREVTKSGVPIAWRNPCVDLSIFVGSAPANGDWDVLTAATQSAAAWSYPQVSGTDIRLTVFARPEATAGIGHDHQNVIVFRTVTWCREPQAKNDAGASEPECYPPSVLAVTSLFKNAKNGELLDTDIEFNAVNYAWGDLVAQPQPAAANTADFQNALTHELGHVVGLDHNCYAANDGQPRLDDSTGTPEVDCNGGLALPETVAQATMYPLVVLTDTTRRTLSPDDELGVSEIYPHRHEVCPSPAGGCRVVQPAPETRWWPRAVVLTCVALLASLPFWRRRRRPDRGLEAKPHA